MAASVRKGMQTGIKSFLNFPKNSLSLRSQLLINSIRKDPIHQRSFWCLASPARSYVKKSTLPSISCSCGGFHSEGDAAFHQMLVEEVRQEKERMLEIPALDGGWKPSFSGADCKLAKSLKGDVIEVNFNVNASVPPLDSEDPNEEAEIVAEPDFTVEIKKSGTDEVMAVECFFPEPEDDPQLQERTNVFSLRTITLYTKELSSATYSIETENIDSNFYNFVLAYLEDRGVDNTFAEQLVDFATAIENREYVKTLEKLQKFVACQ